MKRFTKETRRRMSQAAKARCTQEWKEAQAKAKATPLPLAQVAELYRSGKTQVEIAGVFGVTQKVIWGFMRRHGIPARVAIKRNQIASNNDSWKGDRAGYDAFHCRLNAVFGKPKRCSVCGTVDERKRYEWANLTGRYEDPTDYKRMCQSCHKKYDNARRRKANEAS